MATVKEFTYRTMSSIHFNRFYLLEVALKLIKVLLTVPQGLDIQLKFTCLWTRNTESRNLSSLPGNQDLNVIQHELVIL